MDEEEHLHRFGTPLEPLEKDEVPTKKPLAIEDQIVKDENGKRRFHGAFTGGFSAGFWNTVGSLEGWTPQNFKSSRGEKASKVQQRPEDFMDKEDLGEFGIAPQGIRTRDEFSKETEEERASQRKRKLMQPHLSGPIPGVPVLEQLLRPVNDKVAVRILKSMGWKQGQGVGPRQTRKEKRLATARNEREQYLLEHYGAEGLPGKSTTSRQSDADTDENEEEEDDDEDITFAPDDYEPSFYTPKENRFGMSYTGLSRASVLSNSFTPAASMQHMNLFCQLQFTGKRRNLTTSGQVFGVSGFGVDDEDNNDRGGIPRQSSLARRGQAFGVGAFEEEDEDIYARDDITRYDFSLGDKQPKQKTTKQLQQRNVIEGFSEDKSGGSCQTPYTIDLPRDFQPRNWLQRRSRFAPIEAERARKLTAGSEYKKVGLGRHDLDPDQRARLLGEQTKQETQQKKNPFKSDRLDRSKSLLERISAKSNSFTCGGLITPTGEEQQPTDVTVTTEVQASNTALLEKAAAKTKHLASSASDGSFKPFLADEAKQKRYEQFLDSKLKDDAEITKFLSNLQPVTLSLWDREMEKKEFIQAAKIYRPLGGLMLDRFVSEATVQAEKVQELAKPAEDRKIVMERTTEMWKPCALLCKRYNIAEPFGGALPESEKQLKAKSKMSIFDYLETSINTKADFQTPTIIPKHFETPKLAKSQVEAPPVISVEEHKQKPAEIGEVNSLPVKSAFVPKTPLEQAVDEARDKPISEKTDLFKSIFDDDDDDYEEKTMEQPASTTDVTDTDANKLAALHVALGLPSTSKVSGSAANVLRNNSPPRGIFATLFKVPEQAEAAETAKPPKFAPIAGNQLKIAFKSREERLRNDNEVAMAEVSATDLYGPKLPTVPAKQQADSTDTPVHTEAHIDAKLQQHAVKKRKHEQWVERQLTTSDDSDDDSTDTETDTDEDSNSESSRAAAKSKKSKSKKSHKSGGSSSSSRKGKKSTKKHKEKSKKKAKNLDKIKAAHKSKKRKSKH